MTVARRRAIVGLCPAGPAPLVDVGADHGHVAQALGAIATERHPRRIGRRDVPWVVCDGLAPFRHVGVAVIAGMGARTIAGILARGPRPAVAVLHAQDDPPRLRQWLAEHGWRIDAEALAPEAGGYAEVLRAVPGDEPATGLALWFGPRLLAGDDPLRNAHFTRAAALWEHIARRAEPNAPERSRQAAERAAFLRAALRERR